MEQKDSSPTLTENLLVLPRWATLTPIGVLVAGIALGVSLLVIPAHSEVFRSAGVELLAVCLPALALAIGVLGTTWARTEHIDTMVARYLRNTVGDKLESYLVGAQQSTDSEAAFPPIFVRMERHFRHDITSYCTYNFFDDRGNRFDVAVKSNLFNFEINFRLNLDAAFVMPAGFEACTLASMSEWSARPQNAAVDLVADTLHGSLAEDYVIRVSLTPTSNHGSQVNYQLRQNPHTNFLTSPYLRRYFAEDAAIATYFFFAEALHNGRQWISDGRMGSRIKV